MAERSGYLERAIVMRMSSQVDGSEEGRSNPRALLFGIPCEGIVCGQRDRVARCGVGI